jgi:hypothetical protein
MILNAHGFKRTANQLAKELVYQHGASMSCWQDMLPYKYQGKMTAKEEEAVRVAIEEQLARIHRFLGLPIV